MALSNVALFGGAFLTPVIAGKMTHTLGWEWTFYFIAIFSGVCLPFVYFFVPETAYRRAQHLNTDFSGDVDRRTARAAAQGTIEKEADADSAAGPSSAAVAANGDTVQPDVPRKATFVESLALFNGRKTDESFWKLLLRPFPLFLHPSIAWVGLLSFFIPAPHSHYSIPIIPFDQFARLLTSFRRRASFKALSLAGQSSLA